MGLCVLPQALGGLAEAARQLKGTYYINYMPFMIIYNI